MGQLGHLALGYFDSCMGRAKVVTQEGDWHLGSGFKF